MSSRKVPFITGNYYHIYNKTIDAKRPFENPRLLHKFKEICWYYRSSLAPTRYSDFIRSTDNRKANIEPLLLIESSFLVKILAYCIMPTHFHFLMMQRIESGISKYTSQIQNSFTRYFNTLKSRKGPLFIQEFQARLIKSDEDIKHLGRYIHLNPYSCGYVSCVDDAFTYEGSSYVELVNPSVYPSITHNDSILSYFDNDLSRYRNFVVQNAEYQKKLERHK